MVSIVDLRPQIPKSIKSGWSRYTYWPSSDFRPAMASCIDTHELTVGYAQANRMVILQSEIRTVIFQSLAQRNNHCSTKEREKERVEFGYCFTHTDIEAY
jgi:hypothetical protein